MAHAAEQLVGRPAELDAFDQILADLEQGLSGAIEVVGEPGIGKTRLLAELAAEADRRGQLVLLGSASELERDLPFWVFVDALDEYAEALDPRRLECLDDPTRAELAHVFPSLSGLDSGAGTSLQDERYRTHRAVRALLELLAAPKPLVLILDDLHWADSGSVELVGALLRRPPSAAVLLAMAVRPRQSPERLSAAFERAHRAGRLIRLDLAPLTLEETRELLGGDVDAKALYEESGGNPFYVEQLARSLQRPDRAASAATDTSVVGIDVPPAVAAALVEELGLLSEDARRILEGAAVAGDPFEPELMAAAADVDEAAAVEALDELLHHDLIRQSDVPRRFRFRHPLVRRAVYESTRGGWRLGAHQRSAEALAARGAPVAAQAHHVELSARHGDAAAVALLREAGEAAAQRAPATAARWFEGALRLLAEDAPPEERVELLLARAGSLAATGHFAESHAALIESIRTVPDRSVVSRVRLAQKCAAVENRLGRYGEARARLGRALDELDDIGSPEAVRLMIELAISCLFLGDFEAMASWAESAIDASAPADNRAVRATALAVMAAGGAMAGGWPAAHASRAEAAALIDTLSDDDLASHVDSLAHLALADLYLDHFEESGRHAARALAISRRTGQGDLLPFISANLGPSMWIQGRMAEAAEVLEGAVEAARLVDDVHGLVWMLFNRSYCASAAGDLELALATAEEGWELAQSLDPGPLSAHAGTALALALLETGEASRAVDLLVNACGGDELRLIGGAWRARTLETLMRGHFAAGNRAGAERAADATQACADEVDLPLAYAMAELARAALDLDDGDAASAADRAIAAVVALEGVRFLCDTPRARMVAGRGLVLAGDQDRAAAEFERAAADYGSFGADRFRDEAERELRKLGRTVYRRSARGTADTGLASLTQRELQLARLVVDRKTNPEIAGELFLSQKTVETHLRNIFRKVSVGSRVELARAVEHADRASQG